MTFKTVQAAIGPFLLLLLLNNFSLLAKQTEEAIEEKRIIAAMRQIGHELLLSLEDEDSRVLPIQQVEGRYQIPFERELSFDPGDIISIVDRVMQERGIASHYLVEVEECASKQVAHSFEISPAIDTCLLYTSDAADE